MSMLFTNPKEEVKVNKLKKAIGLVSLVAIFALGLYGCGGDNATPTPVATATTAAAAAPTNTTAAVAAPTDTTAPAAGEATATTATSSGGGSNSGDAAGILKQSSAAMKGVTSYHIVLKTSSAGAETTADGDFMLPDKARMNISSAGAQTQVIVINGDVYTQVPGSDAYYKVPGAGTGLLQGAATSASLGDLAENATIVGDETLDGVDTTHIKFTYSLDKATDAAAQAMGQTATPSTGQGEATAEVWVEKSTNYIHQFMSTSTVAGVANTTTVTFTKFNEDVTPPIEVPANVQPLPGGLGGDTTPTP
jgi:outer membrane lipoprotein-sorting protein